MNDHGMNSAAVTNPMKRGRLRRLLIISSPRFERGDFYVICPDNAVTSEMDAKRILWAADMLDNRQPCRAGILTGRRLLNAG